MNALLIKGLSWILLLSKFPLSITYCHVHLYAQFQKGVEGAIRSQKDIIERGRHVANVFLLRQKALRLNEDVCL